MLAIAMTSAVANAQRVLLITDVLAKSTRETQSASECDSYVVVHSDPIRTRSFVANQRKGSGADVALSCSAQRS